MRDNLIRTGGVCYKENLCVDLIGLFSVSTGRSGPINLGGALGFIWLGSYEAISEILGMGSS